MVSGESGQSTGEVFLETDHVMPRDICKHEYLLVTVVDPPFGVFYVICRFCLHQVRIPLVQPK